MESLLDDLSCSDHSFVVCLTYQQDSFTPRRRREFNSRRQCAQSWRVNANDCGLPVPIRGTGVKECARV